MESNRSQINEICKLIEQIKKSGPTPAPMMMQKSEPGAPIDDAALHDLQSQIIILRQEVEGLRNEIAKWLKDF